jgi:hypothetical protein
VARPLAGLLAACHTAATLGALLISLIEGLFGFRESISASHVVQSLVIEAIAVLALITWTVPVTAIPTGRAGRPRPLASSPTAPADEIAGQSATLAAFARTRRHWPVTSNARTTLPIQKEANS